MAEHTEQSLSLDSVAKAPESLEKLSGPEFWKLICPQLSVADNTVQTQWKPATWSETMLNDFAKRMERDGYFQCPSLSPRANVACAPLAQGVSQLARLGWPPSFIFMYDEAWGLVRHVSGMMAHVTGGNENSFDMLAWLVDPNGGAGATKRGFPPHRDRQPDDVRASFRDGGGACAQPKYATCWIPLTDATTDNSCLCVIPRAVDPGYVAGDVAGRGPVERALAFAATEDAGVDGDSDGDADGNGDGDASGGGGGVDCGVQHIRCLAQSAGGAVVFSHRLIHWGSRGRRGHPTPRVAISVGFSAPDFERPYLHSLEPGPLAVGAPGPHNHAAAGSTGTAAFPTVAHRLALVAAQMISYRVEFGISERALRLFLRLFHMHAAAFERGYVDKVVAEFADAYFGFSEEVEGDDMLLALFDGGDGDKDEGDESGDGEWWCGDAGISAAVAAAVRNGCESDGEHDEADSGDSTYHNESCGGRTKRKRKREHRGEERLT